VIVTGGYSGEAPLNGGVRNRRNAWVPAGKID
jgi:hypothetical protein